MKRLVIFLMVFAMLIGVALAQGGKKRMMSEEQYDDPMYGHGWGCGMMGSCCGQMPPGWEYGYGPGYGMMRGYCGSAMYGCGCANMGPGMMGPGWGMGRQMAPGRGSGYGMMGPGWRAEKEKWEKFLKETRELRRELHMKMFDYREALRDSETSDEEIEKLEKEISKLMEKIQEKAPE